MKTGGLFSKTLYREGMRQTRALGFVFLGILLGSFLLMFVMQVGAAMTTPVTARVPSFMDFYEAAPLMLLSFAWAPIMILVLFHFVDKRNQCDFYHALPHTRPQLACSFLAAILTWTLGGLLAAFGLYAVLYSIVPSSIAIINWAGSLNTLASAIAMLILVTGGAFLATSLTGTVSSSILATGLILFMPRLLLGITTSDAVGAIPILTVNDLPCPLGSYNLVANFFSKFFDTFHAPVGAIVYTLLLGVLYVVLGLWAFTRRKSERAGSASISRGVQATFRVLAASPILLGAALAVIAAFKSNADETNELWYAYVFGVAMSAITMVCISFGVFILYELFTTRSGRRLLKILPTYGFVVLIAAAGALTVLAAKPIVAASVPKAEQVESVSLLTKESEGLFSDIYGNAPTYFDAATQDVEITDPAVCAMVANELKREADYYVEQPDGYYSDNSGTRLCIRLAGGGQMIRTVSLSEDQLNMIYAAQLKNEAYVRAMTQLPDETRTPVVVYDSMQVLTPEQAHKVYASLRQEITEHDAKIWIERALDGTGSWATLYMQTVIGSDVYGAFLPVTPDYPKTLKMYLDFARENADLESWISRHPLDPTDDGSIDIQLVSFVGDVDFYISSGDLYGENGQPSAESVQAWNELVEWIRTQAKKPIDIHESFGRVNISTWRGYAGYSEIALFIPMDNLPQAAIDTLNRLGYYEFEEESDEPSAEDTGEAASRPETAPGADATSSQEAVSSQEAASSQNAVSSQESVSDPADASGSDAWELPVMPLSAA